LPLITRYESHINKSTWNKTFGTGPSHAKNTLISGIWTTYFSNPVESGRKMFYTVFKMLSIKIKTF